MNWVQSPLNDNGEAWPALVESSAWHAMAITACRTGGNLGFGKGAGRFNVKPQVQG
jgi:hypothetical protein